MSKNDKQQEQSLERVKRIVSIDDGFTANGQKYYFEPELTIDRYRKYEELSYMVAYGVTLESIVKEDQEIVKKLRGPEVGGGIHYAIETLTNRQLSSGRQLAKREFEVLLLCSLFIIRDDEDLTTWSQAVAEEKIEDWRAEGISMSSFFLLVSKFIKGLTELQRLSLTGDPEKSDWRSVLSLTEDSQ